jgi:hypothetical protein
LKFNEFLNSGPCTPFSKGGMTTGCFTFMPSRFRVGQFFANSGPVDRFSLTSDDGFRMEHQANQIVACNNFQLLREATTLKT